MDRSLPGGQNCLRLKARGGSEEGHCRKEEQYIQSTTSECVESKFLRLDYLMCLGEWKEMRWKGGKGHILKDLACPAKELDSILRHSEAVTKLCVGVG